MGKLIITEKQLGVLKQHIRENDMYGKLVEKIKADLDMNYSPMTGVMREGGEYSEQPMIKVLVDGEVITPKALYEYLKYKYKLGDDFTKQVIRDWADGTIKDNRLTKNIPIA